MQHTGSLVARFVVTRVNVTIQNLPSKAGPRRKPQFQEISRWNFAVSNCLTCLIRVRAVHVEEGLLIVASLIMAKLASK